MKRLSLCADDYGLTNQVNAGIHSLVAEGRIQAVSCLTESPLWPNAAEQLRNSPDGVQIGLHFNLTLPFGQSEQRVSSLLARSLCGMTDRAWIRQRLDKQWEKFIRHYGRMPDFIDGHQHVHSFPGIREVLVQHLRKWQWHGWVRTLHTPVQFSAAPLKGKALAHISRQLPDLLASVGLSSNRYFAGFRSYHRKREFRTTFREWLSKAPDGTLLMCHPGLEDCLNSDPIREQRTQEYRYLSSNDWVSDSHLMHVRFCSPVEILNPTQSHEKTSCETIKIQQEAYGH